MILGWKQEGGQGKEAVAGHKILADGFIGIYNYSFEKVYIECI